MPQSCRDVRKDETGSAAYGTPGMSSVAWDQVLWVGKGSSRTVAGDWMEEINTFQIAVLRKWEVLNLQDLTFMLPYCFEDCWECIRLEWTPAMNYFRELHIYAICMEYSTYVALARYMYQPNASTFMMAGVVVREVMTGSYGRFALRH